jgi:hypothetical protein
MPRRVGAAHSLGRLHQSPVNRKGDRVDEVGFVADEEQRGVGGVLRTAQARPAGCCRGPSTVSGANEKRATIGLSISPGAIALTRMP